MVESNPYGNNTEPCVKCGGRGCLPVSHDECPDCKGFGVVEAPTSSMGQGDRQMAEGTNEASVNENAAASAAMGAVSSDAIPEINLELTPTPLNQPPISTYPKAQATADSKMWRQKLVDVILLMEQSPKSRERALAITKTQEAIFWLGHDLKTINSKP